MAPPWERRWPGRRQFELDALVARGGRYALDPDAEREDKLAFELEWPLDGGGTIQLHVVYPDTFPFTRPHVFARELAPGRHVSPLDKGVCLIGRGSDNWPSDMTLAELLHQQLGKALAAQRDPGAVRTAEEEEHEGVPAEEWWNGSSPPDAYCLIESEWKVGPRHGHGELTLRYAIKPGNPPQIRAAVEDIRAPDGHVLHRRERRLPLELEHAPRIKVPWSRAREAPLPEPPFPIDMGPLLSAHPHLARAQPRPIADPAGWRIACQCILYPSELAWRQTADGWLFLFSFAENPFGAFTTFPLRTLRAGAEDIGGRVPAVRFLGSKRIAVFGVGAIGAPIAAELARNGVRELRLVDPDLVQPGNGIRWPLGASAWGRQKVAALADHIAREYPQTLVVPKPHFLGDVARPGMPNQSERSGELLDQTLAGADLVVDATAEIGINWLLDEMCRERGIPFITAHATPTLEGGAVARFCYANRGACRPCLDHAWLAGEIPEPRGAGTEAAPHQAPGCAERTFLGANFDLNEISLQAVRLAVDSLSDAPQYPAGSLAQIVSFVDDQGRRIPPRWESFPLTPHRECRNHRR